MKRYLVLLSLCSIVLTISTEPATSDTLVAEDPSSEARVNLGGIFTSATAYFAEKDTFEIENVEDSGYRLLERGGRYSFWYAVKGVPTAFPGNSRVKGSCDLTAPPTSVTVVASKKGFVAAAKGRLEGNCDEWSINDKKELQHTLVAKNTYKTMLNSAQATLVADEETRSVLSRLVEKAYVATEKELMPQYFLKVLGIDPGKIARPQTQLFDENADPWKSLNVFELADGRITLIFLDRGENYGYFYRSDSNGNFVTSYFVRKGEKGSSKGWVTRYLSDAEGREGLKAQIEYWRGWLQKNP